MLGQSYIQYGTVFVIARIYYLTVTITTQTNIILRIKNNSKF